MLLEEIKNHYCLPDFIFKDLLEIRAESLNSEISKTRTSFLNKGVMTCLFHLLLEAVCCCAGIYGVAKGFGGTKDHYDAKDINESAQSIVNDISKKIDTTRDVTNKTIEDYGQRKLRAFNGVINEFIVLYSPPQKRLN